MISIFILAALIGLVCFIYGYLRGCVDQRKADVRALARMAREGAREIREREAG